MPKLRPVNADYQAFEFVTNAGRRLELSGTLLSWQDEHSPGIVEHQILNRKGAIHQDVSSGPSKYPFACSFVGEKVGERYRALVAAIDEDPAGRLNHPRLRSTPAVCESLKAAEDPSESTDEVLFTIRFSETGLRTAPKEGAGNIVAGAFATAQAFTAGAPASFAVMGAALSRAIGTLAGLISTAANPPQQIELQRTVADAGAACASIQAQALQQGRYDLYAQVSLAYAQTIEAYNASADSRPPIILYLVEADTSLPRLCALLYGGRFARAQLEIILSLNRLQNPARILAGTQILIQDPEAVRAH